MAVKTRNERIFQHYYRLKYKSKVCCEKHWVDMDTHIWMPMARTWNMPIKQIKQIVKDEKERRRNAALQQPSRRNRSGRIRTQKSDG